MKPRGAASKYINLGVSRTKKITSNKVLCVIILGEKITRSKNFGK